MKPVKLNIIFFFTVLNILSGMIIIDSEQIKNTPSRDIYDLLSRLPQIHGKSYGLTGQPLGFKMAGKISEETDIYIDDIYYGRSIKDLSGICVDSIEKILVESNTFAPSGVSLKIYTRSYDARIPVSEVLYKDAFHNYRNLSFSLAQNINQNSSFSFSGSILDYKDQRDRNDNYSFPYERHTYRLKVGLPRIILSIKPEIDITFFRENRHLLDSDSSLSESRNVTVSATLIKRFSHLTENKLVFIANSLSGFEDTDNINIYNEIRSYMRYGILNSRTGFFNSKNNDRFFTVTEFSDKDRSGINILSHTGYENGGFEAGLFSGIERNFYKQTGLSASVKYYRHNISDASHSNFTQGRLGIFSSYSLYGSENKSSMSYTTVRHEGGYQPVRDFISMGHSSYFYGNRLKFSWEYITSTSGKINDDIFRKNITGILYSGLFFNDKLRIDLSADHRYYISYLDNIPQTSSNLSVNARARIVNLEFFFGSDNLLKNTYTFNDKKYHINKHYIHQTIEGFDMPRHDEIWGIRWIFFR